MRWALQNPIVFYALMALGLGLCLNLCVTLKREIRAGRRRQEALDAAIGQLSAEIGEIREKLLESEARAAVLVAPTPPRSGVNLSTRSQTLRMFRRGATNQQIAAALGVPEKEVELLLKVQRMALDAPLPPEDAAAPGGPTVLA
jgi:DNA-directed RNA polymerase specialized sigma24 family protein